MNLRLKNPAQFEQLLAALQHSNSHTRAGAAIALGKTGDSRAIEPLIGALEDPVYAVHNSAAKALGTIGVLAVGSILALIQEPPFEKAKSRAGDALKEVRDPNAAGMLCAALQYPENAARWGAAGALGAIGDPEAVPALIEAARHEEPFTRRRASAALGKIGDPRGVQALAALLGEKDWQIRGAAVRALGQIGDEQVALPLLTALEDENGNVRQRAAKAIQQIRNPEAIEPLLATLAGTGNTWIRRTLAGAFGEIGDPRAVEHLRALLEGGDLQTRLIAAQSLARLGDNQGLKVIRRTLNAPNADTRLLAAIALGNTGNPRAIEHLLESDALKGEKAGDPAGKQLREWVIAALVNVGEAAIPPTIQTLNSADVWVHKAAFEALRRMDAPAVEPLLSALQHNPSKRIREGAIRILGHIGDVRAVEPLTDLLRAPLRPPHLLHMLGTAVFDPSAEERKLAASALRLIGAPESAPVLLKTARFDLDQDVREHAQKALAKFGEPESILRLAEPNVSSLIDWGVVSMIFLFVIAFVTGGVIRLAGIGTFALLAGLGLGAAFGVSSGLEGRKRPIRGALIGGGLAIIPAILAGSSLFRWVAGLLAAGAVPEGVTLIAVVFPIAGTLTGWQKVSLPQRLAGLFVGMITGFASAGVGALVSGAFMQ